ncbi:hypothetical protein DVA67_012540 [Solirubrobacter sp. CPCC 204708]|uniref:Uncharacterized protein n=1 Tax=Solirubrobacter deserti TaxID=2282478 RepID=A0ABT4RKW3_9ACTN|nr:hypothetical protein [Solirubrobacter deserti]MBE2316804.1 hypothetical protein [Solirubrobacter deserti]MDA0138981.1 hypothetical protein [Solirubrobacter deserti]
MSPQLKNPVDVMVITRERLQDTLDDAVRRGRMTRDDATELMAEIVRRAISAPAELSAVGLTQDAFPIADYDELTAAQIVSQLTELEPADLRRVRDYERRNANRKTVLNAVDVKLNQ